jgi:hypothetical protein
MTMERRTAATMISDSRLTVAAGEEAVCEVLVRNVGTVVDQFTTDLVGAVSGWTTVEPAVLNLMPGRETVVRVTFAPPRTSGVLAGDVEFGVRVRSREYPELSSVEEGVIHVEPFVELEAELVPAKRSGRRKARYRLAVENGGNSDVRVEIEPVDLEEDQCEVRVDRHHFMVRPGTAAVLRVRARPHSTFLRGEPRVHPFELRVFRAEGELDENAEPVVAKGQLVQVRLVPKFVIPALLLVAALVGGAFVLWHAVLAPEIKSVATEQVSQQAADASAAAEAANAAANSADDSAKDAAADRSAVAATPAPPEPLEERLATFADPVVDGTFQRFAYTEPRGRVVQISDLMLQNSRGDVGFLRVAIGEKVLLEAGLANFTDQPYTYTNALRLEKGQSLVVLVNCVAPGPGSIRCTPAVSFSGMILP